MKMYEFEQITVGAKVEPPQTNNAVLLQAKLENDPNETKEDIAKTKAAAKKHLGMVSNKVAIVTIFDCIFSLQNLIFKLSVCLLMLIINF